MLARPCPLVGAPAEINTPSNPEGLDRVAPYQKQNLPTIYILGSPSDHKSTDSGERVTHLGEEEPVVAPFRVHAPQACAPADSATTARHPTSHQLARTPTSS